jgi:Ca2+-binding RTX toxin-like protein
MATIIGSNSANVLTGTNGNDVLRGLGGNDTLRGLGGNDLLDGGIGRDTMFGGFGNDTYIVNTSTDRVIEGAGGGIDRVLSSVNYAVEIDTILTFTSRTTIFANVDADATPEFILTIPSFTIIPVIPTAGDFIL